MSEAIFFGLGVAFGGITVWLFLSLDGSDWGEPDSELHDYDKDQVPDFLRNRDDIPVIRRQAE